MINNLFVITVFNFLIVNYFIIIFVTILNQKQFANVTPSNYHYPFGICLSILQFATQIIFFIAKEHSVFLISFLCLSSHLFA